MELRRYWQIILRYWWIVLLFLLAGTFNAYTTYKSASANYEAVFQANIQRDLPPPTQTSTGYQDYFDYYRFISTEYVVDDYTLAVKGSEFLTDVAARLKGTKYPLSVDDLKASFDVERKHREITFTVRADNEDKAMVLTKALADNLSQNAGKYLAIADERIYSAKVIDMPDHAVFNSGKNLLFASIRIVIGLLLGLGLAFLLAYLDNRLHTPADFKEALDLPVIGEIPGKPLFRWGRGNGGNGYPATSQFSPEREEARR